MHDRQLSGPFLGSESWFIIVYVNLKSPPRPRNCSKLFTAAPTDRKGVHAAVIHHCLATPFSQWHARWHFLSNSHTVPLPLASQMILVPGRTQMYSIGHHWSRPRYSMGFRKIASDQYPCQPPTAFWTPYAVIPSHSFPPLW
jgi:hypothetical protein